MKVKVENATHEIDAISQKEAVKTTKTHPTPTLTPNFLMALQSGFSSLTNDLWINTDTSCRAYKPKNKFSWACRYVPDRIHITTEDKDRGLQYFHIYIMTTEPASFADEEHEMWLKALKSQQVDLSSQIKCSLSLNSPISIAGTHMT